MERMLLFEHEDGLTMSEVMDWDGDSFEIIFLRYCSWVVRVG